MEALGRCEGCGSPTQCSDGVRERLLLHWINSLPLTKCLLVEELRDLRFGDVLFEVVQWLQSDSSDEGIASEASAEIKLFAADAVVERLRRVVQFAASECRSQDEEAMYIVNDADCVARVVEGRSDAICAVLTVLKRLSIQRMQQQQSMESDRDALHRRRVQEEMIKHSLQLPRSPPEVVEEVAQPKQRTKRVQASRSRSHALQIATKSTKTVQSKGSLSTESKAPRSTTATTKSPTMAVKRKSGSRPPCSAVSCSKPSAVRKKASTQSEIFHDDNGLRVFGMLDPTANYQPQDESSDADSSDEDALALRICSWAQQTLQINMPLKQIFVKRAGKWKLSSPRRVRQVFANGVILCRIALAVLERYGEQLKQSVPEAKLLHFDGLAAIADPQTPIDRRHNLALARAAFEVFGVSAKAVACFARLQCPGKLCSSKALWGALDNLVHRVDKLAHATEGSNILHPVGLEVAKSPTIASNTDNAAVHNVEGTVGPSPTHAHERQSKATKPAVLDSSSAGCAPLKRNLPYITSEQMHVVNEWLTRVGLGLKKAANGGVLQDSMRNGSLLCALLTQVLKSASFPFFKTPRALTEMRENISKAFEKLGNLPGGRIPPCYLTASAEQAVLIGDRQVSYGILWHLWQLYRENRTSESPADSEAHKSSTKDPRPKEKTELASQGARPLHPSPLLLDIPAVALAGRGKFAGKDDQGASIQVKLHESFARRLAWSKSDPQDDDDDLFPVPKAPFSSPVYSESFHPESFGALGYELNDQDMDLLPVRTEFSTTAAAAPNKPGHDETTFRAPSIALSELSGEDTARVAPVKTADRSNDERLIQVEPSPIKASTAPAHSTSTISREPVKEVLSWLKGLNIYLKNASALQDPSATLTEFQSGVLLCCIVEKVEFMRSIPGITRPSGKQPLSKASALHNITKALAILQQKKTMPLHFLRRAAAIYAGDRAVILQLLLQIRKAYGHHHNVPRRRPKQQQAHPSAA